MDIHKRNTSIPYKQRKINITADSNRNIIMPNTGNDENGDEIESFYQKIIEDGKFKVYDNGWKDVTFTVFRDTINSGSTDENTIVNKDIVIEVLINFMNLEEDNTSSIISLDIINQYKDVSDIISLLQLNNKVKISSSVGSKNYYQFDIIEFFTDSEDDIIDFVRNNDGKFKANTINYKFKVLTNSNLSFLKNKSFYLKNIIGTDVSQTIINSNSISNTIGNLLIPSGHTFTSAVYNLRTFDDPNINSQPLNVDIVKNSNSFDITLASDNKRNFLIPNNAKLLAFPKFSTQYINNKFVFSYYTYIIEKIIDDNEISFNDISTFETISTTEIGFRYSDAFTITLNNNTEFITNNNNFFTQEPTSGQLNVTQINNKNITNYNYIINNNKLFLQTNDNFNDNYYVAYIPTFNNKNNITRFKDDLLTFTLSRLSNFDNNILTNNEIKSNLYTIITKGSNKNNIYITDASSTDLNYNGSSINFNLYHKLHNTTNLNQMRSLIGNLSYSSPNYTFTITNPSNYSSFYTNFNTNGRFYYMNDSDTINSNNPTNFIAEFNITNVTSTNITLQLLDICQTYYKPVSTQYSKTYNSQNIEININHIPQLNNIRLYYSPINPNNNLKFIGSDNITFYDNTTLDNSPIEINNIHGRSRIITHSNTNYNNKQLFDTNNNINGYLQLIQDETNQIRNNNGFSTIDSLNSHLYIYKLILNQRPNWINQTLHQFGVIYHNNDYIEEVTVVEINDNNIKLLSLVSSSGINGTNNLPTRTNMDYINNNVQVYFPSVYKDKLISLNTKKVIKSTNVPSGTISFEIVGTSDVVTCNVSDIQFNNSFVGKLDSNHNYVWNLVTELSLNSPMNNPWTGTGESGAASVLIPLNTLSSSNGTDLEIKIEWDNNDGTTSSRFYKGWYLNEVFDYTRGISDGTVGTVYAKWNENDNWYESTQHSKNGYTNKRWNWMFNENGETELAYTDTLTGKIGYHNVGFLIHGSSSNTEIANGIYSGGDEYRTGKYSNWQSWSKLRVYVKKYSDFNNNSIINLDNINITDNINNNLSTLQAKVIDFNTNYIKIKPSINIKNIISQMSNYNFISSDRIYNTGDFKMNTSIYEVPNSRLFENIFDLTNKIIINNRSYKIDSIDYNTDTFTIILDDNIPYKKFIYNSEEVFSFELFNTNTWQLDLENYNNTYLIDSYNNKTIKIVKSNNKILNSFGGPFIWLYYDDINGIQFNQFNNYFTIFNVSKGSYDIELNSTSKITSTIQDKFVINHILDIRVAYDKPNYYRIQLPRIVTNVSSIEIVESIFHNTSFILKNNNFEWSDIYNQYSINLDDGYYTTDELITEIQEKLIELEFNADITISNNQFTLRIYDAFILPNPFTIAKNSKTFIVNHPNHNLQTNDKITIEFADNTDVISNNEINKLHTVTVLNKDAYSFDVITLAENSNTNIGGNVRIKTYKNIKMKLNTDNTIGKILGFHNAGESDYNHPDYSYQINNNEYNNNQSIKHINLFGHDYIMMEIICNQSLSAINDRFFTKILLNETPNNKVFNSFTAGYVEFREIIPKIEFIDVRLYDKNGELFEFYDLEHSFTLKFTEN